MERLVERSWKTISNLNQRPYCFAALQECGTRRISEPIYNIIQQPQQQSMNLPCAKRKKKSSKRSKKRSKRKQEHPQEQEQEQEQGQEQKQPTPVQYNKTPSMIVFSSTRTPSQQQQQHTPLADLDLTYVTHITQKTPGNHSKSTEERKNNDLTKRKQTQQKEQKLSKVQEQEQEQEQEQKQSTLVQNKTHQTPKTQKTLSLKIENQEERKYNDDSKNDQLPVQTKKTIIPKHLESFKMLMNQFLQECEQCRQTIGGGVETAANNTVNYNKWLNTIRSIYGMLFKRSVMLDIKTLMIMLNHETLLVASSERMKSNIHKQVLEVIKLWVHTMLIFEFIVDRLLLLLLLLQKNRWNKVEEQELQLMKQHIDVNKKNAAVFVSVWMVVIHAIPSQFPSPILVAPLKLESCVTNLSTEFHQAYETYQNYVLNNILPGELSRKYSIVRTLGYGAFGVVYQCRQLLNNNNNNNNDDYRAIKLQILPDNEDTLTDSMIQELSTLRKLKHPNIVETHEIVFDVDKQMVAIAMEFASNGSLYNYIRNKLFPHRAIISAKNNQFETKARLAFEILCGLRNLHDNNLLHLDLKAQNILVNEKAQAKLADFGISERKNALKSNGDDIITWPYRAPELMCGQRIHVYGTEADIWSYGCVVFQLFYCYDLFYEAAKYEEENRFTAIEQVLDGLSPEWHQTYNHASTSICKQKKTKKKNNNNQLSLAENAQALKRHIFKTVPKMKTHNHLQSIYNKEEDQFIWTLLASCFQPDPTKRATITDIERIFHQHCPNCKEVCALESNIYSKPPLEEFDRLLRPAEYIFYVFSACENALPYARELYKRFTTRVSHADKMKLKSNWSTLQIQVACVAMALRLLQCGRFEVLEYIASQFFMTSEQKQQKQQYIHYAIEQLNRLDIDIGQLLNWNLDGK